jgi:GntR family transcriptional regulator
MGHVRILLKRDSQIPLYLQVKEWVLGEIQRGVWDTGSLLPSERTLVGELGVSRITVRQALRELVQEGVLESVPGKGFFVAHRPSFPLHGLVSLTSLAKERSWRVSNRVLAAEQRPASPGLARTLELDVAAPVIYIARVRFIDEAPVNIQRLWLPERRCRGLLDEDLSSASIFALLTERFGIELDRAEITISARTGDSDETEVLGLDAGAGLLTVDQVTRDRAGEPVEFSLSAHHPGRFPVNLVQERPGNTRLHLGGGHNPD